MKFTLKDYQTEAVADVLKNLNKAKKRWHEDGDINAFSLTATTGAGKTVMAAAVFEALFFGDDDYEFDADTSATVIWFSDDPSLNEQTRFRLLEASDKLDYNDLVVVDKSFNSERFEPGKIYFLNTQKLTKTSLLVKGYDPDAESESGQGDLLSELRPDLRSHTIWEVLKNTIEDPNLTLYMVLDEAHRGMGATKSDATNKSTIVKRLINGSGSVPPMPVVWGISATVERFNQAMQVAKKRDLLHNVEVEAKRVQESGLLKDTIVLDIPDETGQFDTVLLRRGTEKLRDATQAWNEYCLKEGLPNVVPLMVLQVPNKPNLNDLGTALDTIFEVWPELRVSNVAHVFGEKTNLALGKYTVFHTQPERVQDEQEIKVLLAKDAISTGWDCPRAEVMVSFRPAKDRTHITQLLGRMVRTPLARRIPGYEQLNSVDCLLPFYDRDNVTAIAEALMHGGGSESEPTLSGRRVLINPIKLLPNDKLKKDIWDKFNILPSQLLPRRALRPIKRLTLLAHELAQDNLKPGAGKEAHSAMHKVLDNAAIDYRQKISEARKEVLTVEGVSLRANMDDKKLSFDEFVEEADFAVIEDAFKKSTKEFSPDITRTYAEYLADKNKNSYDREDALLEAHIEIAALGLVPEISDHLNSAADTMASEWLDSISDQIYRLNDERQDIYAQIREMSREPQDIKLKAPRKWTTQKSILEPDGREINLPTFDKHVMCDEDYLFPALLNKWELKVLSTEMKKQGFEAWYRNPEKVDVDSLSISYVDSDEYRLMRPDFIFFSRETDENLKVDIVDPHGVHLSDVLPKLRGLAKYAEKHSESFRRIQSVADPENDGKYRVLDLQKESVRQAIQEATDAKLLFRSEHAEYYPIP